MQKVNILGNILKVSDNNQRLAGEMASNKVLFGQSSRYAIYAVHTRFDSVQWIVADAEAMDELTKLPAIIRQEDTAEKALAGFDNI